MAQEDVRIKANPSVLAINQTPAQISIVEEISINNGAFPILIRLQDGHVREILHAGSIWNYDQFNAYHPPGR